MKSFVLILFVFCACSLQSWAAGDTLVIALKNNQTDKFAVAQIQKITFGSIASGVNDDKLTSNGLRIIRNYPNPAQ